jgi:putative transcriptional regulator
MTHAGEVQDVAPGTEAYEPEIRVHLDELVKRSGKTAVEVAEAVGIHPTNLSRLRNGHVSFIRLDTLLALCLELECQPGDLLTVE